MENRIYQLAQIAFIVLMGIVLVALYITYSDYNKCLFGCQSGLINGIECCSGLREIYVKWIEILGTTFASIVAYVFVRKGALLLEKYINKPNNG